MNMLDNVVRKSQTASETIVTTVLSVLAAAFVVLLISGIPIIAPPIPAPIPLMQFTSPVIYDEDITSSQFISLPSINEEIHCPTKEPAKPDINATSKLADKYAKPDIPTDFVADSKNLPEKPAPTLHSVPVTAPPIQPANEEPPVDSEE